MGEPWLDAAEKSNNHAIVHTSHG